MDWMRRNWPDLVIAIALVAVIAGIVLTLITGGTLFPLGGRTAPRAAPDPVAPRSLPAATTPRTAEDTGGGEGSRAGSTDPVIAPLPPIEGGATAGGPSAPSTTERGSSPAAAAPAPATPSPTATAPAASRPAPAASAEGLYRVSVGAFANADNAGRLADRFRDDGFPVFIGTQGDLSLVLVGPYDSETEAERAAERVRAGGYGVQPVIYRFRPDPAAAAAPAPSAPVAARPSAPSTPAASAPVVSANGRYLQVGAYGSAEVSRPQRERLEALGFPVTQRSEGGLVKLLVGPFAGDELSGAQARLDAQDIDYFLR